MNPGSAQQLVSAKRRELRAQFQSFEIGGGEFTQTVLDARRARAESRRHLVSALRTSEAIGWTSLLQIATSTRHNQPVASQDVP
jgi:hypothetical protein